MRRKKSKIKKDRFLAQYDRQYRSIASLVKKHKHKAFIGYVLNLLEGVMSVERLSRQLQKDYNLTFRLIDEIKDANAKLFEDMPEDEFAKVTDLFAELNFLISQRLGEIMIALYNNRDIPKVKLPAVPVRKPRQRRSLSRTSARSKR